jgi:hypothetical protein
MFIIKSMSTGYPKDGVPLQQLQQYGGLAVRSSTDACKGCRRCCQSLTKTVGNNRGLTAGCIALPMLTMAFFLIYIETAIETFIEDKLIPYQVQIYRQYKLTLFSPFYILASITFGFGLLAMLSIKCEYQNILRFCAFVYRGIAHWILLSVFLLTGPIAGYLPVYMVFQIACWSLFPSLLWLFTAGVMTAHSDLISQAIEDRATAMNTIHQELSV